MGLQHKKIPSRNAQRDHYFLCNYMPLAYGKDELSKSLLRFKNSNQIDVQAWVECSLSALANVITKEFVIVRALHGEELAPTNSSLDLLGRKLQEAFQCTYQPDLIRKSKHTKSLKFLNKRDRTLELKDVYSFESSTDFTGKSFLIIDDILTTGATLRAIEDAITSTTGIERVSYFTLAYCDNILAMNQNVDLKGENYSWKMSYGWSAAEPHEEYTSLYSLKVKIDTDFGNHIVKKSRMHR